MELKMFKSFKSIKLLESKISENIDYYFEENNTFESLIANEPTVVVGEIEKNFCKDLLDFNPHNAALIDIENSEIVWKYLSNLDIRLAHEPRLWVCLNHTLGLKYIKQRIKKSTQIKTTEKTISSYFFGKGRGGWVREPNLSGLWFRSYIARKITFLEPNNAIRLLCSYPDLYYMIATRPSLLRNSHNLNAVFKAGKAIIDNHNKDFLSKRNSLNTYRPWLKKINFEGGYKLLDMIPDQNLKELFVDLSNVKHN